VGVLDYVHASDTVREPVEILDPGDTAAWWLTHAKYAPQG